MATAAKLAAQRAQKSADGKNTIFYQADKPSLNGRNDGDLWFDTDDGYKVYVYNATAQDFVDCTPKASVDVSKVMETFTEQSSNILPGNYPPDGGTVNKSVWVAPDGRVFKKIS